MSASLIGRLGVKRFHCSRARASLRNRYIGPSTMGFEDEVERSLGRPCRVIGRSKRTHRELPLSNAAHSETHIRRRYPL